jgi:homospermidine synthase
MSHNMYVNTRNVRLVNTPLISPTQLGTVYQVHVSLIQGAEWIILTPDVGLLRAVIIGASRVLQNAEYSYST